MFQAYTIEELWVEFYEDYFEAHPHDDIESIGPDGNVQFVTGDDAFDALEQRIQDGATDDEILAELAKWEGGPGHALGATSHVPEELDTLGEGFEDTYT